MKVRIPDKLGLPAQEKVETELLKLLASGSRPVSTAEAYRRLADTFGLTAAQRTAPSEGGRGEPAWNYRVRWAMEHIEKEKGWARRIQRGMWTATAAGKTIQRAREQSGSKVVGVIEDDILSS
jgi:restriction endonuclease Mrr